MRSHPAILGPLARVVSPWCRYAAVFVLLCGDNQSHVNVLQDLELVLGLGSDRGPLVLVREGPTKASGHFTYLVNAHGPDIDARERTHFLFRLGALQPVAHGVVLCRLRSVTFRT